MPHLPLIASKISIVAFPKVPYIYVFAPILPSCATALSPGPGTNLVLYPTPVSIALLISSYISKITRFVRYSPNSFSSLRFTIGNVYIM